MGKKINLNDIARPQRAEAERERRKAEAERVAANKERCFKRAFSDAIERLDQRYSDDRPRPHPNNAGRRPIKSPAGEAADKGRKWGGGYLPLPGSFETGKRR